jgi:hypothetical protein
MEHRKVRNNVSTDCGSNSRAAGRSLAKERTVDLQQLPPNWPKSAPYRATTSLPNRGGRIMGTVPPPLRRTLGRQPERSMPETKLFEKKGPTWTV